MAFLCCGFCCKQSTSTPVVSIRGQQPVKCDPEKITTGRPKHITWMQFMGLDKYRPDNWEEPTYLPGQLMDDDLIDRPRLLPERTFAEFERKSKGMHSKQHQNHVRIAARQYRVRSPLPPVVSQGRATTLETSPQHGRVLKPVKEILPNQSSSPGWEAGAIHTAMRGSAPRPMPWKDLYENVMKPREQIMSIYNATAARYANRSPTGVVNVSPASNHAAERVEVRTPVAQREDRLRALRARLKQKLRKPRLRKKDSTRRPKRETEEWAMTEISDIEDGDEEDEILYSTYRTHQDCEYFASDGNDGHESGRDFRAPSSRQGARTAEDEKQQSRAAYTPEPHAAARKSSTPTRQASRASYCLEPVIISRPTSSTDVEEVFVLPEEVVEPARAKQSNVFIFPDEVAKPAKARRVNALSKALKRMNKRSTRVSPSAAVEPPAAKCAWDERSSRRNSPEERTIPNNPAAECQAKDPPDDNMAPVAVKRSVTGDPLRAARDPPCG